MQERWKLNPKENEVTLSRHGVRMMRYPLRYAGPAIHRAPRLAHVVYEMADWDVPCSKQARALTLKVVPGTSMILVVNYRRSPVLTRRFGPQVSLQRDCRSFVTNLHKGIIVVKPGEELGVIVVRLWAEVVADLWPECIVPVDAVIGLDELFPGSELAWLEESLGYANRSAARFAYMEQFLLKNMRARHSNPVAAKAAALLRRNPHLRVRQLAALIEISERQLLRAFDTVFGMGPKQFARIARIEGLVAARAQGGAWGDAACKLGFFDQAHMIKEFSEIVGLPPTELMRAEIEAANGASGSCAGKASDRRGIMAASRQNKHA